MELIHLSKIENYNYYIDDLYYLYKVKYNTLLILTKLGIKIQGVLLCKDKNSILTEVIYHKRKSPEYFRLEYYNMVGDEYTLLSDYYNNTSKIKVKHNVCGCEYEVPPYSLLSGRKCFNCFGAKKLTTMDFKKRVFDLVGDEYIILNDYINAQTKVKFKHNACGYEFNMIPRKFTGGQRCPKCAGQVKLSFSEVSNKIKEVSNNKYELLEYSNNAKEKSIIKHLTCEKTFNMLVYNFVSLGFRCPYCLSSLPESILADTVKKYFNDAMLLQRHDWLKYKSGNYGELDVYIPSIKTAIEYDGVTWHSNASDINKDLEKDKILKHNSIKIIRIREYGLDSLNDNSEEIFIKNTVNLSEYKGIVEYSNAITELLRMLNVNINFNLTVDNLNEYIYRRQTT